MIRYLAEKESRLAPLISFASLGVCTVLERRFHTSFIQDSDCSHVYAVAVSIDAAALLALALHARTCGRTGPYLTVS